MLIRNPLMAGIRCCVVQKGACRSNFHNPLQMIPHNLNQLVNITPLVKKMSICYQSTSSRSKDSVSINATEDNKKLPQSSKELKSLTKAQKLKKAIAEYGSTVIVFHVGISLLSLGTCYVLVSTGLNAGQVFLTLGLEEWATKRAIAANAGTFAVAYTIHKIFAPVRITMTLASVPFIVRYLRHKGVLKK